MSQSAQDLVNIIASSVKKYYSKVTFLGTRTELDATSSKPDVGMTGFLTDEDVLLVGKGVSEDPTEFINKNNITQLIKNDASYKGINTGLSNLNNMTNVAHRGKYYYTTGTAASATNSPTDKPFELTIDGLTDSGSNTLNYIKQTIREAYRGRVYYRYITKSDLDMVIHDIGGGKFATPWYRDLDNSKWGLVIYVDNSGNNKNHGFDAGNAVKTIKEAISRIPLGGGGEIRLAAGKTFTLDEVVGSADEDYGKTIMITSTSTSNKAFIKTLKYTSESKVKSTGFSVTKDITWSFRYVNMILANKSSSEVAELPNWGLFQGWFSTASSPTGRIALSSVGVNRVNTAVTAANQSAVFTRHNHNYDVSINYCTKDASVQWFRGVNAGTNVNNLPWLLCNLSTIPA